MPPRMERPPPTRHSGYSTTLHTRPAGTRTVAAAGATIHIDALDADIEPGLVTVLTGPNGVGKTTLLQTDSRVEPRRRSGRRC